MRLSTVRADPEPDLRFDIVTLELVLAIAETRSITRGAEREHLALAAASKRLSDLEARLGVSLFERRARGVEPTEAGRAFVRHVRSLHASLHALESEVAEFARGIKGHLRIAANTSAIAECLPADVAAFSRAHPGVRITLDDLTSAEVQAAVAEGRADVGVFVPPLHEARLAVRDYREGALAALAPAGHPLADASPRADASHRPSPEEAGRHGSGPSSTRPAHRFDALLDYDIVGLHVGTAAHELMRERAQALGRALNTRVQVHGFDAIAQLVEAGLGVAVLPAVVAERLSRIFGVVALQLLDDWARRQYLVAVREQEVLPAVVQRFVDALRPPPHDRPQRDAGDEPAARQSRSRKTSSRPAPGTPNPADEGVDRRANFADPQEPR